MRTVIKMIAGLGGIALVLLAALVLINLKDEPLNPEIADFLVFAAPTPETNAYFAFLGFDANQHASPHDIGLRIEQAHRASLQTDPWGQDGVFDESGIIGPDPLAAQGDRPETCAFDAKQECFSRARLQEQQWRDYIDRNRAMTSRYHDLLRYPHFVETSPAAINTPIWIGNTSEARYMVLHGIVLNTLDMEYSQALDTLGEDLKFWRMVLAQSRSLIARMVATAYISHDVNLLAELLNTPKLDQTLYNRALKLLQPLDREHTDLSRAMRYEFEFLYNYYSAIPDASLPEGWWNRLDMWGQLLTFKVNATANLTYAFYSDLEKLAALPAIQLKQALPAFKQRWTSVVEPGFLYWRYAYNPTGKILLSIAQPALADYFVRAHNLDGYIRLLAAKYTIRKMNLSDGEVAGFLATSSIKDPYTNAALSWDPKAHTLSFACIETPSNDKMRCSIVL